MGTQTCDDQDQGAWSSLVLLERYRGGDDEAAAEIFDRYVKRLTALARSRLSPRLARRTDPEDIVLSVYRSFFLDARQDRYTLSRGGDLWRLLAAIAKHKLLRQARSQSAERRSVSREVPLDGIDEARVVPRRIEPTPEDASALADELEQILAHLDAFGRRVLELRLQGAQLAEIADDTGKSERSVRRALAQARTLMTERMQRDEIGTELCRVDAEIEAPRRSRPSALPEDEVRLEPDRPLLSHRDFLLRRLIGAGRMGKVYEAWQQGTGRPVAVKFLRNTLLHHPDAVRRFVGEARTVARLHHPNIVGTHGLGRTPGGSYFIVMDLVAGPDLARLVGQRVIGVDEAVRWTIQACEAVAHAHERGVVHCDLKPANLLRDESEMIRVTDFGLARSLAGERPMPGLAEVAVEVEGTAPFMAPEQADRCWGPIGFRTDVYGIGAVLFALLTGRPPFLGRRIPDVLAEVVSAAPVVSAASLRPDLPESLDAICRRCLAKEPAARFESVAAVRQALGAVAAGS